MTDQTTNVTDLKNLVLRFAVDRDWVQFHRPKDLGLALASEVGELLDLFRFKSDDQIDHILTTSEGHQAIAHELADCLWALLRLSDVCQIDLASALREKVQLAGLKYPIDQSFGRNDKYTAYSVEGSDKENLP